MSVDILGIKIDNVDMGKACAKAVSFLDAEGVKYVVTPNPELIYMCTRDPSVKEAAARAALSVADGVGVTRAARKLGTPLKCRVPGVDLGKKILPELVERKAAVFLLGGEPGVAEQAANRLAQEFPGLVVAGYMDGFFQNDSDAVDAINATGAQVLYCCMGMKKELTFLYENANKLTNVRLALALGGSIDIYAGAVKRAPELFRRAGMEWLYRLVTQPTRIKRMAVIPKFNAAVAREARLSKRGKTR